MSIRVTLEEGEVVSVAVFCRLVVGPDSFASISLDKLVVGDVQHLDVDVTVEPCVDGTVSLFPAQRSMAGMRCLLLAV